MIENSFASFRTTAQNWIGDLPQGWSMKPLKFTVTCNDEKLPDSTDLDYQFRYVDISSVSLGNGIEKTEELTFDKAPSRARRVVRSGDILVSTVRTYLKAITNVRDAGEDLVASTGFAVLRSGKDINSNFLGYFAESRPFVEAVVAQSTGVSYPASKPSDIIALPVCYPSIQEQQAIACFLDEKTAHIDGLIAKKEELLKRLAEKRSAIITNAVTKGLNPDAPMKDSGIDWLGQIPAHWDCWKIQHAMKLKSGDFIQADEIEPDDEFPVYGGGVLRGFTNKYNREGEYILIGRQGANCGNVKLAEGRFWATEHALVVTPLVTLHQSWLLYVLEVMNLNQYSVSSAQPGLSVENLKRLSIPFPPVLEQKNIATKVGQDVKSINGISSEINKAIDRLREYRSAIITAAVTGQIKVA